MFGRKKQTEDGSTPVNRPPLQIPVSLRLENAVHGVVLAVEAFLETPSDAVRTALMEALEQLDTLTTQSDAFASNASYRAAYHSPGLSTIGETGSNSIVEEVPFSVFQDQIELVKEAKRAVNEPISTTSADLRAALENLMSAQALETSTASPTPTRGGPGHA